MDSSRILESRSSYSVALAGHVTIRISDHKKKLFTNTVTILSTIPTLRTLDSRRTRMESTVIPLGARAADVTAVPLARLWAHQPPLVLLRSPALCAPLSQPGSSMSRSGGPLRSPTGPVSTHTDDICACVVTTRLNSAPLALRQSLCCALRADLYASFSSLQ